MFVTENNKKFMQYLCETTLRGTEMLKDQNLLRYPWIKKILSLFFS